MTIYAESTRCGTNCLRQAIMKPLAGSRGVTLIEILVAVCILSIGLISLAGVFSTALRYQEKMLYTQIASASARSELDIYTASAEAAISGADQYWTQVSVGTRIYTNAVSGLPSGNKKTVVISTYPPTQPGAQASSYLKKIKATVAWPGPGGDKFLTGSVTYVTLIAKPYKETDSCYADL